MEAHRQHQNTLALFRQFPKPSTYHHPPQKTIFRADTSPIEVIKVTNSTSHPTATNIPLVHWQTTPRSKVTQAPNPNNSNNDNDNSSHNGQNTNEPNITITASPQHQPELKAGPTNSTNTNVTTSTGYLTIPFPSGPIPPSTQFNLFNLNSEADFLMASLVPVLLATLLSIPIQILVSSLNSMLTFRALTHRHGGATGQDSLTLSRSGHFILFAPIKSIEYLRRLGDPLTLLNLLLSTLSIVFVPLSSEVIRLEYSIECDYNLGPHRCALGLRKALGPMQAAETLLVVMAVLVIGIGVLLVRWRSGVPTDPWSIASMASLFQSSEERFRELVRSIGPFSSSGEADREDTQVHIAKALEGKRF